MEIVLATETHERSFEQTTSPHLDAAYCEAGSSVAPRVLSIRKMMPVVANSYDGPAVMVREAATFPLIVRVLFIACVAMLAGNALVLILNLETTRRSNAVST